MTSLPCRQGLAAPTRVKHTLAAGLRSEGSRALRRGCRALCRAASSPSSSRTAESSSHGAGSTCDTPEARLDAGLRSWIEAQGGYIHPAISIAATTQCGCRGLVASQAVSEAALEAGPLLSIPRHLHLDNRAAVASLAPRLACEDRREHFSSHLGQVQQVAAALAAERAAGAASAWALYIESLPVLPPNPWLLSGEALAAAAAEAAAAAATAAAAEASGGEGAGQGGEERCEEEQQDEEDLEDELGGWEGAGSADSRADWAAAAAAAAARYGRMADEVLEVLAGDVPDVDKAGLMWALGQVSSRCLGSGSSAGLLPYVDMANHHPGSRPPMMQLDERDRVVFTVTSIMGDGVAPLAEGQELFISYQAEGMSPLRAWLKWGFVPGTLRQPARR